METRPRKERNIPVKHTLTYGEIIESNGVKIPFVPGIITPPIEGPLRNSRYEGGECAAVREIVRPGDRVLELGAGLGLLSTIAAQQPGVEAVTTVEANPALMPMIEETWRLNGAMNTRLLNGIVAKQAIGKTDFFIRRDFWASSMEAESRPFERTVKIESFEIADLIRQTDPTVILCDIEGAELGLFDDADLSSVRAMVLEVHPKIYGLQRTSDIYRMLEARGLRLLPVDKSTTVRRFERQEPAPVLNKPPAHDPSVFVATCMKDEGPFILEWIAWHKAIGVTDFVVFTNDCTDGTDLILDRLEDLGHLRHLPNPALATGSTYFQPMALGFAPFLREFRQADYFISMDVDEFINVRLKDGSLRALFDRVGYFDALSMSELNHGSNRRETFEPGLVTEQFPCHETETPGRHKANRGVKTIVRLGPKLNKPRNHRPDFDGLVDDIVWLDGSGQPRRELAEDSTRNGLDVRGSYDCVSLEHYPLRSLSSYLAKMARGDVVVKGKQVSPRYWRLRNRNEHLTSALDRQQPAFRKALDDLMSDPELHRLHVFACEQHAARIDALMHEPEFRERRAWVLENAW